MKGSPVNAVTLTVMAAVKGQQVGGGARGIAAPTANDFYSVWGHQNLVGNIQPHHRKGHTRTEHNIGCMRINIYVELCSWRYIARVYSGTPH